MSDVTRSPKFVQTAVTGLPPSHGHSARPPRLGEVLVKGHVITQQQLDLALQEQKRLRLPLGQVLVQMNFVTDELMRQALATQLNIPFIDLTHVQIDRSLSRRINANYARRQVVVPVSETGQVLTIAMDDPTNLAVIEELSRTTGRVVTVVTSSREAIKRAFDRVYGVEEKASPESGGTATETVALSEEDSPDIHGNKYLDDQRDDQEAGEIVRRLLRIGVERGCSDIHIETLADKIHIRFRVDGILQEISTSQILGMKPTHARRIVSRIKILSKMDISERRRPQDGSFRIRTTRNGQQSSVDFRVSVLPSYTGESVVLRILDRSDSPKSIDDLGFSDEVRTGLREVLSRPTGIALVTGPTGSGKSTSVYASLMTVYRPEIRILTAEDPVEFVYEQFSQSEVNERIGNTFATYLRGFLRHDPDVIMIGEIRDEETATMALRAAQTGHFVLSTLHTNTAVGTISRLLDLGVDANLVASSLLGVLSQRLIRATCSHCSAPYMPPPELLREFFVTPPADAIWLKGRGCQHCNFTGYKGRMPVDELWRPSEEDVVLISKGGSFEQIRASSRKTTISMARDVMGRLLEGRTNLEELIRVLPYEHVGEFRRSHESQLHEAVAR